MSRVRRPMRARKPPRQYLLTVPRQITQEEAEQLNIEPSLWCECRLIARVRDDERAGIALAIHDMPLVMHAEDQRDLAEELARSGGKP